MFGGPGEVILGGLEQRLDIVPSPAGAAKLAPMVVIGGLTAHIDHAVDRRAAAKDAAARIDQFAPVQARLGGGLVAPVGARIADAVKIADGDMDPMVIVAPARLDQQDPMAGIRGQAVGKDAARAAGADDDEIIGHENSPRRRL